MDSSKTKRIRFNFTKATGIENLSITDVPGESETGSEIRLINCRPLYKAYIPKRKETIAEEIVTHFLPYFMRANVPEITIHEDGGETLRLVDVFERFISEAGKRDGFELNREKFDVVHAKTRYHSQRNREHKIYYVAAGRVVETENLTQERVPDLPGKISMDGQDYIYVGYVESNYLDRNVNQLRNGFDISRDREINSLLEEPTRKEISTAIISSTKKYLNKFLSKAIAEREQKVKEYITKDAPYYSYIYKNHKNLISEIPFASIEKGTIGEELQKIHLALRSRLNQEAKEVLSLTENELASSESSKARLKELVEELNEPGKAELAEYIIQRKIVLELLHKAIKIKEDGNFEPEGVIHNFVFPIRSSSDDITYKEHNLWLLDERLAYNTYIASDKQFSQIPGHHQSGNGKNRKRPDLYVYTFATVEVNETSQPYKALDIFEFKRPMRNEYTDEENPYSQILDYLETIRTGSPVNKDGRTFSVVNGGLIYCHVICDLTSKLRAILDRETFQRVGNEDWYFRYHPNYNALIEIKSFDLILDTAKKRNQILFDKLGI